MKIIFVLMLFGLLIGSPFAATCAAEAYQRSCSSCSFDASGKMDRDCSDNHQQNGLACTSTAYPIMSAKYAGGECPQLDACAAELSVCISQYSSGDDRADCQEGSVAICYAVADECTANAAAACGEVQSPCSVPAFVLMGVLVLAGFAYYRKN